MDGLVIVSKIQKMIRDRLQAVGDTMITGGVDNMEKYPVSYTHLTLPTNREV